MFRIDTHLTAARRFIKLDRVGRAWTRHSTEPWRPEAVDALQACGMTAAAESLANCGFASGWAQTCTKDPGHYHRAIPNRCKRRYCPLCQYYRNRDVVLSRIDPVMHAIRKRPKGYTVQHLIFTTRYSLSDPDIVKRVKECRAAVYATLDQVLRKVLREELTPEEIKSRKFNPKAHHVGYVVGTDWGFQGEHLHFHVFYLGPRVPYAELREVWKRKTKQAGAYIYPRKVLYPRRKGEIVRLLCYVVKVTLPRAERLPVLIQAIQSGRQASMRGVFYGKKQRIEPQKCTCGARLHRVLDPVR